MLLPPFTPNQLQQMASPPRAWFFLLKERLSVPLSPNCLQEIVCMLVFFPPNNFSYLILRWQKTSKETATSIICSFIYKCTLLYEARITQSKKFKFLQQCVDLHFAETMKQNQICLCCIVSCIHAVQHLLPFAITLFIWTVMLPLLLLPPHGRCAMMHMSHFHSNINLLDQGPQGIR